MCTALDRILALFVTHTTEEVQFGCPWASLKPSDVLEPLIAVARSCAGHMASVVVHHGNQVHGAIGKTRVDELQESTDPTLAWRSEFGSAHD
ncbi:hypothetical protein R4315_28170 [Rhodococcus oxybenzonivorans]|uniref:Uncharacterized protein n=1 Tax=Rhodococcus oxybenzonivorans TaxID=1990687 RepID=A0AAE4V5V6_9NOCA|nr:MULTISPECIES: hypothetical protein [Rhodococcus]MDV7246125.1 hypothetical protein [Rhodococcus oxybenzonivorans]MDV7268398.1 hypothetical protein [Rhodococcus oxybenzonivorans]MDV7277840.1 hypothetical protein [Rhodococcus oxybenzonivorans]MDV7337138.1 hypothetical protein [Rhodococcus oxybenzonivorans]MDV7347509.1 hypothetical protein [Rhodococcus oxybenzonivorans]